MRVFEKYPYYNKESGKVERWTITYRCPSNSIKSILLFQWDHLDEYETVTGSVGSSIREYEGAREKRILGNVFTTVICIGGLIGIAFMLARIGIIFS